LVGSQELQERDFTVHLKDVKMPWAEKSGFEFIDMGHDTCRFGAGVAGIVRWWAEKGFRGPIGVEHEPPEFDPREDGRISLEPIKVWWADAQPPPESARLRVAVVGCGNIAGSYGAALHTRPEIEILSTSDLNQVRAKVSYQKHGGAACASLEDVWADLRVEVVTKARVAGKHVHSEKPLASTFAEARQLVAWAKAKNLRLSCAPVTWLGEAQQTAWKLVRDGRIGRPRVVYAAVDWARIESWPPNPWTILGGGPGGRC